MKEKKMITVKESLDTYSILAEKNRLVPLCDALYSLGQEITFIVENNCHITKDYELLKWHNERLDATVADKTVVAKEVRGRKVYGRKPKYPNAVTGLRLYNMFGEMEMMFGAKFQYVLVGENTNEEEKALNTAGDYCSV